MISLLPTEHYPQFRTQYEFVLYTALMPRVSSEKWIFYKKAKKAKYINLSKDAKQVFSESDVLF